MLLNKLTKWGCAIIGTSIIVGTASALFLWSLQFVTHYREHNHWIIWRLPIVGIVIVYLYKNTYPAEKGFNLILDEYYHPQGIIPWLMSPLIIITTLLTHLVGGSAGREVAPLFFIGATLTSALSIFTPLPTAVLAAMGFVSVFAGATKTPLACIIMAIELFGSAILPFVILSVVVAYIISGKKSIYKRQRRTISC